MRIEIPSQESVIGRYGAERQSLVHAEECGELIQAISKARRAAYAGKGEAEARRHLAEEMADVLMCMSQIQAIYGITDQEIQEIVSRKCARQEARLRYAAQKDSASSRDGNLTPAA